MPKAQVLVATTNPSTGEPLAAGSTADLDDEAYQFLRQAGSVAASEEETKAGQRDYDEKTGIGFKPGPGKGKGTYDARTGRAETGGQEAAPRQDDTPPPKEQKK